MKPRVMTRILLASVSMHMVVVSPAWADVPTPTPTPTGQTSVLMRRPIDMGSRSDTPTTNPNNPGGGGNPNNPTDPTDPNNPGGENPDNPGGGTDIPTDNPIDGGKHDPDLVTDPGDPGWEPGTYQWTAGPWQGAATCGKPSSITREVGCQRITPNFGGPVIIGRAPSLPGTPEVMPASWGMSTPDGEAKLTNGVYDPQSSDVKAHLAQFGGDGGGDFKVTNVPISYCMEVQSEIGPPPINTYTGTKAGCQYDPVKVGSSAWELPPGSEGTASCSANAFRVNQYKCMASDGTEAPLAYCVENLGEGSQRNGYLITPEYGNFSSCTARWVTYVDDNYCHKSGDLSYGYNDDGPVHTAYYQSRCIRSDGKELTGVEEVSCAASDRPFDGVKVVGGCHKQYSVDHEMACIADGNEVVVRMKLDSSYGYGYYTEGTKACNDAGATCCSLRLVANSNYSGAPYNTFEVIGTKGEAVSLPGWYFDDHAMRISDKGEGPYFNNWGGGKGRWEPDEYVGGVIDPEPGNGGGGGEGPAN